MEDADDHPELPEGPTAEAVSSQDGILEDSHDVSVVPDRPLAGPETSGGSQNDPTLAPSDLPQNPAPTGGPQDQPTAASDSPGKSAPTENTVEAKELTEHAAKGSAESEEGVEGAIAGPASMTAEQRESTEGQRDETSGDAGDREGGPSKRDTDAVEDGAAGADAVAAADGQDPNIRGDEFEVESDEVKAESEEPKIPDDFYYEYGEVISKPKVSDTSEFPADMLTLRHSLGYDCLKRANLHVLDEKTLAYVAGNIVQVVDLGSKEQMYLRSTGGGGIGALAVHPSKQYFAVGEKGTAPNINVFEWPSRKLFRILRGGTQAAYAYMQFSPDGKILASVGGEPDYMLTLWDWRQERTVLRSKAFSQDVFRVSFASELEGQLTSSGTGHIRFWKMASTFTGLKLQGQLGKFGKTEISDIEGYVELPDGKVLSGCEWGNMLLWDGGLIKVEIVRKGKKSCHVGPIQQIIMEEGELVTVGSDGYIRVWDFEAIDTADSPDDSGQFEMEPMNEVRIGTGDVKLRSIVRAVTTEDPIWFAQDASGGVWRLDLSFSHTSAVPERLMTFHAGAIHGCCSSPVAHLVATTGADRTVRVYDYAAMQAVCEGKYNAGGSALLWLPNSIDAKGATIVAGFEDGVMRVLLLTKKEENKKGKDESELLLAQVFKPHTKRIASVALDNKGEILATASEDSTVFFFTVGSSYEPIGFVELPGPATHAVWSPGNYKRNSILVTTSNGYAVDIDAPEPGTFDTSHSYQITGLKMRTHKFKSIKSKLRHEEELERKRKIEEDKRKQREDERRIRLERGVETEEDQRKQREEEAAEEEKQKAAEEEWKPYIPAEPSAILHAFYSPVKEGVFYLSMEAFDAGYLYECKFVDDDELKRIPEDLRYEPIRSIPVDHSRDVPINTVYFSDLHRHMILGMQDGTVRIQSMVTGSENLTDFSQRWELPMHDSQYGSISCVAMSHDGRFLFTVGADGNFFIYNYMTQEELDERTRKAKLPSAHKLPEGAKVPDDIDDPHAYSIEDAKQKAEHDRLMQLAEEKKQEVRRTVAQLRRQFKKLMERNHELPSHLRLDLVEFEMDPEIKRELDRQTHEKIDAVKKELAWESEKQQIALDKLNRRFKAIVECERIVVKAFQSGYEVSTFRASKLSDDFRVLKQDLNNRRASQLLKANTELARDQSLLGGAGRQRTMQSSASDRGAQAAGGAAGKQTTTLKGTTGERIAKALGKVEEKRRRRAARKAEWDQLYASKPDDKYEDPADVAAIKDAEDNMGDYKLKTADDYVVPDHLRMNVEKAIIKLLTLKELIHDAKYAFNQRVLALREKKLKIISSVEKFVAELQRLQKILGPEKAKAVPAIPKLHPDEVPERRMEYTRESLLAFKEDMVKREKEAITGAGGGGGFGGFGGAKKPEGTSVRDTSVTSLPPKEDVAAAGGGILEVLAEQPLLKLTPLEQQLQLEEEIRLSYQRDKILSTISEDLGHFDSELRCVSFDKLQLSVDLKNADLRYITLFEEYLLLKEYEKHENILADKVASKNSEKLDQQNKAVELQQKMELKKKDIDKLQEKEKALHAMFVQSLGDNNKFADYLTKVFKKKIKRSKKKENTEGDSDEDSDDDDDDDEDWEESDEESGSEGGGFDLDICPPGCDQNIYDNTCQLREKRLDIEEALAEEKKIRDQMNKDLENLQKKSKVINAALKSAETDLEAFQLEKQQKLNEFDIVVTMRLHQVLHNVNGILPSDLSQCLVFGSSNLSRLSHRIKELEHEKSEQKKQQKEAKKTNKKLIQDRRLFEAKISELEAACDQEMVHKFGRIVDLERLEQVTVNRTMEELKEKLRQTEIDCSNDLRQWEEKIQQRKDAITDLVRENTRRVETLNMLQTERKTLQVTLDARQKNLGGEFSGARRADVHERHRLFQLVALQSQEIGALKEEIVLLSHKGGHILPPTQPPMPVEAAATLRGGLL